MADAAASVAVDGVLADTAPGGLAPSDMGDKIPVVLKLKLTETPERTDNQEPVSGSAELQVQPKVAHELEDLIAQKDLVKVEPSTTNQPDKAVTAQDTPADPVPLPSDQDLAARLATLLKEADLSTVTERSLRRRLEAEFGVELASKKLLIRSEIEKFLADQGGDEEQGDDIEEEEEQDTSRKGDTGKKRRRGSGLSLGCRLSPELATFLGRDTCARTEVVKLLWAYIKEHELQDPSDKRRILLDEKLSTIFPGKSVTMFKMNKHLSKHCKVDDRDVGSEDDEEQGESVSEGEGAPKQKRPRSAAKAKSASKRKPDGASPGEKKLTGFNKPVRVSEALAAWCGKEEISRPELTKYFYDYVKTNDLYDPNNKQYVVADDTLKQLTGEARFRAFGIQGLLKQHFNKS